MIQLYQLGLQESHCLQQQNTSLGLFLYLCSSFLQPQHHLCSTYRHAWPLLVFVFLSILNPLNHSFLQRFFSLFLPKSSSTLRHFSSPHSRNPPKEGHPLVPSSPCLPFLLSATRPECLSSTHHCHVFSFITLWSIFPFLLTSRSLCFPGPCHKHSSQSAADHLPPQRVPRAWHQEEGKVLSSSTVAVFPANLPTSNGSLPLHWLIPDPPLSSLLTHLQTSPQ